MSGSVISGLPIKRGLLIWNTLGFDSQLSSSDEDTWPNESPGNLENNLILKKQFLSNPPTCKPQVVAPKLDASLIHFVDSTV